MQSLRKLICPGKKHPSSPADSLHAASASDQKESVASHIRVISPTKVDELVTHALNASPTDGATGDNLPFQKHGSEDAKFPTSASKNPPPVKLSQESGMRRDVSTVVTFEGVRQIIERNDPKEMLDFLKLDEVILPFVESCAAFLSAKLKFEGTIFQPKYEQPTEKFLSIAARLKHHFNTEESWYVSVARPIIENLKDHFACVGRIRLGHSLTAPKSPKAPDVTKYGVNEKEVIDLVDSMIRFDSIYEDSESFGNPVRVVIKNYMSTMPFPIDVCESDPIKMMMINSILVQKQGVIFRLAFYNDRMTAKNVMPEEEDTRGIEIQYNEMWDITGPNFPDLAAKYNLDIPEFSLDMLLGQLGGAES